MARNVSKVMTLSGLSHGTKLSTSPQSLLSLLFNGTSVVAAIVSVTWRECHKNRCCFMFYSVPGICSEQTDLFSVTLLLTAMIKSAGSKPISFSIGDHSLLMMSLVWEVVGSVSWPVCQRVLTKY